jgi:Family of unknown function (DUF5947)
MNRISSSANQGPLATLRRFARAVDETASERCEFCGLPLARDHRHLLEVDLRRILCACDPCALRFENVIGGRFKLIPRHVRALPEFQISDAQWDELAIPINLAFLFFSTPEAKTVALYPSPAGATESLLTLSAWQVLAAENPGLASLEPDVEALLVNRIGHARDYFIAPIDICFSLVGIIRLHWRGLSGGDAVWRECDAFFARLRTTSRHPRELESANA